MIRMPSLARCLLTAAFFWGNATSQQPVGDSFETCKVRVERILNGTEIHGAVNNETIISSGYLYGGPVRGMNPEYARTSRKDFITLTTKGCKVICGNPVDWYWSSDVTLTLSIISNWILPILALLAAFPYDSLHKSHRRILGTFGALLNWLGSPQTALAATWFSIYQNWKCSKQIEPTDSRTRFESNSPFQREKKDAYYVLSCIGQFELRHTPTSEFLRTLIYGLFRPLGEVIVVEGGASDSEGSIRAQRLTKELLREMAFQLRMLRRRGVYPAFLSILLFCIAYAVSLVMAFATIGERTTAHSLAFGILISWLPILLLFAIIDRNPISTERSSTLIARWLWNVRAVGYVENPLLFPRRGRQGDENHNESNAVSEEMAPLVPLPPLAQQQPQDLPEICWWKKEQTPGDTFSLGEFMGQGRQIGYNGLAHAILHSVYNAPRGDSQVQVPLLESIVNRTEGRLNSRPRSWWCLSLISLLLVVWLEILMAFMISYNIPTIGIGCRSASYLIYGVLSTVPWLINLFPLFGSPVKEWELLRRICNAICRLFTLLSTFCLTFILFAAFSGVLKNCTCRGGLSGYLDFEDAHFYKNKNHFDVATVWKAAAIVGALPIFSSFIMVLLLLKPMKVLWQDWEQQWPHDGDLVVANMGWLM